MQAMWKMANCRMNPLHGVILITMMYMKWYVLMPTAAICTPVARVMFRHALICKSNGLLLAKLG